MAPAFSSPQHHPPEIKEPRNQNWAPGSCLRSASSATRVRRGPGLPSPITHPSNEGRTEGVVPTAKEMWHLRLQAQGRGLGPRAKSCHSPRSKRNSRQSLRGSALVSTLSPRAQRQPCCGRRQSRPHPAHPGSRDQHRAGSASKPARAFSRS